MTDSTNIPELDNAGLRKFGRTMGLVVALLFGLFLPWLFSFSLPWWPWLVGGGFIVWGVIAPASLGPFYKGWMKFGLLLNRFTSPILMGLIFFLVFTPVGLFMKLIKRDSMNRRMEDEAVSYREVHEQKSPLHMDRPF